MSQNNVVEFAGRETHADPLTELLRKGAEQLIYATLLAVIRFDRNGRSGSHRNR
jgi:hypothetical protein